MATIEQGTVSHGTLNPEHLIPCFLDILADHDMATHDKLRDEYGHTWEDNWDYESEEAGYLLEALFDALDNLAPEGMYFGALEGDGSDFGFWQVQD